ncbi:hypothetical protein SK128_013995, partial [Halocaridina rubra]
TSKTQYGAKCLSSREGLDFVSDFLINRTSLMRCGTRYPRSRKFMDPGSDFLYNGTSMT